MKENEAKSVCAIAKDTPRAGFRLVEAVVDSGAEESVTPPNVFPGEIHASAMSKMGGKYKAANGTRIPNLGQQKVRFHNVKAKSVAWDSKSFDSGVAIGSSWKSGNIQGTRW